MVNEVYTLTQGELLSHALRFYAIGLLQVRLCLTRLSNIDFVQWAGQHVCDPAFARYITKTEGTANKIPLISNEWVH